MIFELIYLEIVLTCGIFAMLFVNPTTWSGVIGIFLLGCAAPIVIHRLSEHILFRPDALPICQKKRCRAKTYLFVKHTEEGDYYRCGCGDLYLLTPEEEFRIVKAENITKPYMRRYCPGGPWRLVADTMNTEKNV